MPNIRKLDPTGERVAATEAMETTPISGKEHEYRADGDHHPRQDAAAVDGGRTDTSGRTKRHISKGIPGAGEPPETPSAPDASRDHGPRASDAP